MNPTTAIMDVSAPTRSNLCSDTSREFGMARSAMGRAARTRTTGRTKSHRQLATSTRTADTNIPRMPPPPADGGPHTDRLGTLFGREGRGNDREGDGHDHRRADAAEESCGEHDLGGGGQTRRRACHAKDDQARDQDWFAAPAVTGRTERQQQRGQGDGVDVDHPQDVALRCVKGEGELRLGDIQSGHRRDDCHEGNAHPYQDCATPAGFADCRISRRDLCRWTVSMISFKRW